MEKIRVLVVDDTSLYRAEISRILKGIEEVEVVGTASNGELCLRRVGQLRPDLVTLDVEMPGMDGIEVLRRLKESTPETGVVMVSAYTSQGAKVTVDALGLGAFDFVTKPSGPDPQANRESLRNDLRRVVNAFLTHRLLRAMGDGCEREAVSPPERKSRTAFYFPLLQPAVEIVAIGVSTGGPHALGVVLPGLPADLRVPVVVVQHMPATFTGALSQSLDEKSRIRVVEGKDGMVLEGGTAYIAPGGVQMKVTASSGTPPALALVDDPPENHCKPAADYLFRSVAEVYQERALGVIMSGMGADGRKGLKKMKEKGARVIAQDEQSCVVFGMPMEAIKAGVVDEILPLDRIAEGILRAVDCSTDS